MSPSPRAWFDGHVYGTEPAVPDEVMMSGEGTDRTMTLRHGGRAMDVPLRYEPPPARPGPVVIALNFAGNDLTRGGHRHVYPIDDIRAAGWGLATFHADSVAPDDAERWTSGAHDLLGLDANQPDGPGALSLWAWGLSRAADVLLGLPEVSRVAVLGHSRMGKAALLAAYRDPRFAAVISNQSGCGGAALFKGKAGERIDDITRQFPHWFCRRFTDQAGRDDDLPYDQDHLLRGIAPRPVLVCSADDDAWADPDAERRCADAAGAEYHLRTGGHNLGRDDWTTALDFLNRRLG